MLSPAWKRRRAVGLLIGAGLFVALAGCVARPVMLTLDDAIEPWPGGPTELRAYLQRDLGYGLPGDLTGRRVRFLVGDEAVGEARTNRDGLAVVRCDVPPGVGRFVAISVVGGTEVRSEAPVFRCRPGTPAIVVDIDETLSETELESLLFEHRDTQSDPLDDSVAVLRELAPRYQLIYLTARPRFLLEKSRAWLAEHGYPPGPLLASPRFRWSLGGGEAFKTRRVKELGRLWPNLRYGIGDRLGDMRAYRAGGLTALLVLDESEVEDEELDGRLPPGVEVLEDWNAVGAWFRSR